MAERFLIISFILHIFVLYCQSCCSLAGMDANKKRKRCSRNEKFAKARVVKQQKFDKPEPVLPEKIKKLIRKIGDFDFIVNQLNDGYKVCWATPLLLTRCKVEDVGHLNLLLIVCQDCNAENRIIIHSSEVEEILAR